MKVVLGIALLFTFLYCIDAHVVYKKTERGWASWNLIEDKVCRRPASGECSKAGTCCGRKSGTQRMRRECVEGHCEDAELQYIRSCNIRCHEADDTAYGPWEQAGNCERPATGECAERKPPGHECCGKLLGKMKFARDCKAAYGCDPAALQRYKKCNLRCGAVHVCELFPPVCENDGKCIRERDGGHSCRCTPDWTGHHCDEPKTMTGEWSDWISGECSVSCGGTGVRKYTRTCSEEGKCEGSAEKTEECNEGACPTCSRPGVPYKGQAVCKTPNGDILDDSEPHPLGTECHYSCSDGLIITPGNSITLTCTSAGMPDAEWSQPEPCCRNAVCSVHEYMDLLFIVDISNSMLFGKPETRWHAAQKFLHEFVSKHLTIGPDNVRVGIIPFARRPDTNQEINFIETTTKEKIVQDIDKLTCCESGTNQSYAMNYAVDNMLTTEQGDRSGADTVIVVITDGVPSTSLANEIKLKEVQQAANRIRTKGTTYAIGISLNTGKDAKLANDVMDAIVGPRFVDNKLIVNDSNELIESSSAIIEGVLEAGCNVCVGPEN